MLNTSNYEFWFCTGSQDLYGQETLDHVAAHSKRIVEGLNNSGELPFKVVWKPTLITSNTIRQTFNDANADPNCAGVICWMHTFSPAKSWILGLKELRKPMLHFHTQFNEEIPYDTIDMDFMNENQSAHGDREFGHMVTRMGIERTVVVGHWQDFQAQKQIAQWMIAAVGFAAAMRFTGLLHAYFIFLPTYCIAIVAYIILALCMGARGDYHEQAEDDARVQEALKEIMDEEEENDEVKVSRFPVTAKIFRWISYVVIAVFTVFTCLVPSNIVTVEMYKSYSMLITIIYFVFAALGVIFEYAFKKKEPANPETIEEEEKEDEIQVAEET